jgi:hypothetical protein
MRDLTTIRRIYIYVTYHYEEETLNKKRNGITQKKLSNTKHNSNYDKITAGLHSKPDNKLQNLDSHLNVLDIDFNL